MNQAVGAETMTATTLNNTQYRQRFLTILGPHDIPYLAIQLIQGSKWVFVKRSEKCVERRRHVATRAARRVRGRRYGGRHGGPGGEAPGSSGVFRQ